MNQQPTRDPVPPHGRAVALDRRTTVPHPRALPLG
jgi:hypothetical protein